MPTKEHKKPTTKLTKAQLLEFIDMLYEEIDNKDEELLQKDEEIRQLQNTYEELIDEKNREILHLKGKIMSKDITLTSYKDKIGQPILSLGDDMEEMYPGEVRDMVLELIQKQLPSYQINSRGRMLLQYVVDSNPEIGERKKIKQELKQILQSADIVKNDTVRCLNELGIAVDVIGSGHRNLYFKKDPKHYSTISSTPSDVRSNQNSLQRLYQALF